MQKIVVPVDFSRLSEKALSFALAFARAVDGQVVLVHVMDLPMSEVTTTGEVTKVSMEDFYTHEFIKGVHKRLNQLEANFGDQGVVVTSMMKYGNTYKKISATIAEEQADYIIMGSHGASGLQELLVGSNAERVVRYAPCPVIVVTGETNLANFKNLLFVTDASEEQDKIAKQVIEIQQLLKLNVHLLKVRTHYNLRSEKEVKEEVEAYAMRNGFSNYTVNSNANDYVEDGAIAFAEEVQAGMMIIGTHGKTGLGHFIGGSRAEDLVNESSYPVMTIKI